MSRSVSTESYKGQLYFCVRDEVLIFLYTKQKTRKRSINSSQQTIF